MIYLCGLKVKQLMSYALAKGGLTVSQQHIVPNRTPHNKGSIKSILFYSSPKNKTLALSNLRAIADNKLKMAEWWNLSLRRKCCG